MIAPKIILDKSTLRGLKLNEIKILFRSFDVLIPPILVEEISKELSKKNNQLINESMATSLSQKITSSCRSHILSSVYNLISSEMLGIAIDLNPLITPKADGIWVRGKDGSKGIHYHPSETEQLLQRWAHEDFSENDVKDSFYIREMHEKEILLSYSKNRNEYKFTHINEIKNWYENIYYPHHQKEIFLSLAEFYLPPDKAEEAIDLWREKGFPLLRDYLPYCDFFHYVSLVYVLGSEFGLLNNRKSLNTHLDIQYLYYLPFCHLFATGDLELTQLATFFSTKDQIITTTDKLKQEIIDIEKNLKSNPSSIRDNSRKPSENYSCETINATWAKFTNSIPEKKNIIREKDTLKSRDTLKEKLEISNSAIGILSNKSMNPIYTQEYDKLSLKEKNLIVLEKVKKVYLTNNESDICRFFSRYADFFRPDSNLGRMLKNCVNLKPKPLWMCNYSCDTTMWYEQSIILLYFPSMFSIDPINNPWQFNFDFNPINKPYPIYFQDIYSFYQTASESIYFDQMLILPRIEQFYPEINKKFNLSANMQQVMAEDELLESKSYKEFTYKKVENYSKKHKKNDVLNLTLWTPSVETSLLLSRLTNSIPITSSIIRKNKLLSHQNNDLSSELKEIQSIFNEYRFKFFSDYSPYEILKIKKTNCFLEINEILSELFYKIQTGESISSCFLIELRNKLKELDFFWNSSENKTAIFEAKLSIHIGSGEFNIEVVKEAIKKMPDFITYEIKNCIFISISEIKKFN